MNLPRYIFVLLGKFLSFVTGQILNKKFSHLVTLRATRRDESWRDQTTDGDVIRPTEADAVHNPGMEDLQKIKMQKWRNEFNFLRCQKTFFI